MPLRKICRRPETDYRLQQLHALSTNANAQKIGVDGSVSKVNSMGETIPKQETIVKQQPKPEERIDSGAVTAVLTPANVVPNSGESKLPPSKIDAEMLLKS